MTPQSLVTIENLDRGQDLDTDVVAVACRAGNRVAGGLMHERCDDHVGGVCFVDDDAYASAAVEGARILGRGRGRV